MITKTDLVGISIISVLMGILCGIFIRVAIENSNAKHRTIPVLEGKAAYLAQLKTEHKVLKKLCTDSVFRQHDIKDLSIHTYTNTDSLVIGLIRLELQTDTLLVMWNVQNPNADRPSIEYPLEKP